MTQTRQTAARARPANHLPASTASEGDGRWQAVLARDRGRDGDFVYAVASTGIYCRPSCPSRRPRPENVGFFRLPEEAEQAGYRACKRCAPRAAAPGDPAAVLAWRACRAIEAHEGEASLAELAAELGVSPFHLRRGFTRAMGVSPKDYAQARRVERLKAELRGAGTVTTAMYEAGYGSSRALYEGAGARLGMTPATYRKGGRGLKIGYTVAPCPLGWLLVATTERGVCAVSLGGSEDELVSSLTAEFGEAELRRDDAALARPVAAVLEHLAGERPPLALPLDVRGTAFQWRVWEALQAIPSGETRSYLQVAQALGQPSVVRAVARACATNPVALAIPCHRVVREGGALGGYRWGLERKAALLERERGGS